MTLGEASQLLIIAGGAFMVFAVPAGYLAGQFGRKKTIISGLIGFALGMVFIFFADSFASVKIALVVVGACWAMVNINSLPMVVDSVSQKQAGAYTGLYYFASLSAAIAGPIAIGQTIDLTGYRSMFLFAVIALGLAAFFLNQVTKGEARPEPDIAP